MCEQFLHSCPRDLALFIRERAPASVNAMMKLATVYTDSRLASGLKDKVVSSPSVVINPTPLPSSDQQLSSPRCVRDPSRYFLCNAIGHKAQQCRSGRPRVNSPSTSVRSDKGVVFSGACLTFHVGIPNCGASSCASNVGDAASLVILGTCLLFTFSGPRQFFTFSVDICSHLADLLFSHLAEFSHLA